MFNLIIHNYVLVLMLIKNKVRDQGWGKNKPTFLIVLIVGRSQPIQTWEIWYHQVLFQISIINSEIKMKKIK
jgi:predicted methyltransferase